MRATFGALGLLLVLFLYSATVRADQVTLSNGDVITGEITEIGRGWLQMETEYAGAIDIEFSKVSDLVTEREARIHFSNGDVVSARIECMFAGWIVLVSELFGEMEVQRDLFIGLDRVSAMEERIERDLLAQRLQQTEAELGEVREELIEREKEIQAAMSISKLWSGSFSVGAEVARGNSDTAGLHVDFKAVREIPFEELGLRFFADYSESEGETNTNRIFGESKLKVFQTERRYLFGVTSMEYDEIKDLDLRAQAFGGLGYNFIKDESTLLLGEVGAGLTGEFFDEDGDEEILETTMWLNGEWKQKIFTRSELLQLLTIYPSLSDFGQYRLRSESSVLTPLNDYWAIKLSLIDDYDSDPEGRDVENNDVRVITSINYKF